MRQSAVDRANMDVNGQPARARVAAETMYEAVDLLRGRLDYRPARLEYWTRWRGGPPVGPFEWHGRGGSTARC